MGIAVPESVRPVHSFNLSCVILETSVVPCIMAHGVDDVLYEGTVSPNVKHCEKKVTKAREGRGAGSRRIFSPHFKLQVLDSYRRDSDCRGNQRATARKYGIHRRQIQKWLQMESTLRCNAEVGPPEAALNLARQRDSSPALSGRLPSPPTPPARDDNDFIDVDKISDSEDDVSSDCSFTDPDRALDFTCAALSKRRFFSVSFKLEVLNAFYNDALCKGNQRATARKFGIHRRQVQKWLDHEQQLRTERITEDPECAECLDLSKRRRLECLGTDKSHVNAKDEMRVQSPSSVQETALCLVKQPAASPEVTSTVELYRPYNLSPALPPEPNHGPGAYESSCCSWTSTPYYPYYGVIHSSYVSPWLPPHEVQYYKQPLNCLNLYTPMYTS